MSNSVTPRGDRPYGVVLFGASGFTGKLVAEYLAGLQRRDLRFAIAGRNRTKLEEVRRDLVRIDPNLAELTILIADSTDKDALRKIADQQPYTPPSTLDDPAVLVEIEEVLTGLARAG